MNTPTRSHACARLTFQPTAQALLSDSQQWVTALTAATEHAGATVLDQCAHEFNPHGCSVVLLLSESHASVHTWPEHNLAEIDIYTCGDINAHNALEHLIEQLQPTHVARYQITLEHTHNRLATQ